jgi:lipid II:glycine glycyltransferase (peptidoglycan interpeptide bridge formation enzyme)
MELIFIKENRKERWNDFVIQNLGSFLQSFEWGKFQESLLKKVYRIKIKEDKETLAQALLIEEKLPFKSYFYIPYGPVFRQGVSGTEAAFKLLLEKIQQLAQEENAIFLRIEPINNLDEISGFNFQDSFLRVQPQKTLLLELERSKKDILDNFHQKTRYNVRLAKKRGVKIKILDSYSSSFFNLMKKTRERQEFHSYSDNYYKNLFKTQSKDFKKILKLNFFWQNTKAI